MILEKTNNNIFYCEDNGKYYSVNGGEAKELDILEWINENNFQLSCELEDNDLRNRVIDLIRKFLGTTFLLFVPFIGSGQSDCYDPATLMQECRDRAEVWFDAMYSDNYYKGMPKWEKNKLDLVKRAAPVVVYMYVKDGGVLPSVKMSMAGLESSWGSTYSAKHRNNYYNIKSYACMKRGYCNHSTPCTNINDDTPKDMYRGYESLWISFHEHDRLLRKSRYNAIDTMYNPYDQIKQIKAGGYATDSKYVAKLSRVVQEFVGLDRIALDLDKEIRLSIIDLTCEE